MILAFESSCDDTCVAIVKNGRVLANAIGSQILVHRKTQGVVPEVAAREHAKNIKTVLETCLKDAKLKLSDITAIACANQPGMTGCLLVGSTFASALAALLNLPIYEVNHKLGHVYSCFLERERQEIKFPFIALSVSGGHNELYLVEAVGKHTMLGSTLDDAAGEAYDKVAKMLGLNYPGGPEISRVALEGNPKAFSFPCPLPHQKFNFSFSGLKTNVKYKIQELSKPLNPPQVSDIAASFQHCINTNLVKKTLKAVQAHQAQQVHLVGGVSANLDLRKKMQLACTPIEVLTPQEFSFCTDNAAMIGVVAELLAPKHQLSAGDMVQV